MTPRYVSVSEIQDFLSCRWRWYAKWVLNRVPRRYSDALIVGTAVHDALEGHFKDGELLPDAFARISWDLATYRSSDPDETVAYARAHKVLQTLRDQIVDWKDAYPVETLAVEEPFEMQTGVVGWTLRGRPDRPVLLGGKVYHMQHKTCAGNTNPSVFAEFLSRSLHERLYGTALEDKHAPLEYAGTIVNMFPKKVGAKNIQVIFPVTPFSRTHAVAMLRNVVGEMRTAEAMGLWEQIDNPQVDAGKFGNSLDGYLPVLQGKTTLDDDGLFMPRRDTYA